MAKIYINNSGYTEVTKVGVKNSGSVDTYKQTSPYSQYADKIFPLSEYVETT